MSIAFPAPVEQRLVLSGVPWSTYESLLRHFEGRHLRLSYDRGELEIMTVSPEHERAKKLLARLLEALTEELDLPIASFGNTTFRRKDAARGLEPDECWYIQHEEQMRDRKELDLLVDPPPDLVIEVEISRSVIDRMELYARLGVPEVWRYDGEALKVCLLNAIGEYAKADHSLAFPTLSLAEVNRFLARQGTVDETRLVKAFRAWVRESVCGREARHDPGIQ